MIVRCYYFATLVIVILILVSKVMTANTVMMIKSCPCMVEFLRALSLLLLSLFVIFTVPFSGVRK